MCCPALFIDLGEDGQRFLIVLSALQMVSHLAVDIADAVEVVGHSDLPTEGFLDPQGRETKLKCLLVVADLPVVDTQIVVRGRHARPVVELLEDRESSLGRFDSRPRLAGMGQKYGAVAGRFGDLFFVPKLDEKMLGLLHVRQRFRVSLQSHQGHCRDFVCKGLAVQVFVLCGQLE